MLNNKSHFANRVKDLRKTFNLSQDEFGKRIGVAKSTVCHYEQGVTFPSKKTLENMAYEFSVPPSYFLDDPNEFNNKKIQTLYGSTIPIYEPDDIDSILGTPKINVFRSLTLPIPNIHASDDCIATNVPDNSMNKIGIRKGAMMIIDRNAPLIDSDIIAVVFNGKLSLRRYHNTAYGRYITTESTKMPASLANTPIPKHDFQIVGKMIYVIMESKYM